MKLKLELVPKRIWRINLRSAQGLGEARWDTLRRKLMHDDAKYAICGGTDRLQGHEVWEYTDRSRESVAKLIRVEPVCAKCHAVHHWGRTKQLAARGAIEHSRYLALRKHFRTVNRCSQRDMDRHIDRSFRIWHTRNERNWRVDWGDFAPLIREAEAARAAWAGAGRAIPETPDLSGPGHHMPERCPSCRRSNSLEAVDQERLRHGEVVHV